MSDLSDEILDNDGSLRLAAHLYVSSKLTTDYDIFAAIEMHPRFNFPEGTILEYLAVNPDREDVFNNMVDEMTLKKIKRFNATKVLAVTERLFEHATETASDDNDVKTAISAGKSIIDLYVKLRPKPGSDGDPGKKSDLDALLESI